MENKIIDKFIDVYGHKPQVISKCPGRVEIIGNHTDYNNGTCIGATIDLYLYCAISCSPSVENNENKKLETLNLSSDISNFIIEKVNYKDVLELQIFENLKGQWISYPLGVYKRLLDNKFELVKEFNLLIMSEVPHGAGLSTSAALELAFAIGLLELSVKNNISNTIFDLNNKKDLEKIILICKEAENIYVKTPCGILDQAVCGIGDIGKLVHIDCKSNDFSLINFDTDVQIVIFNTNTKHKLVDSLYSKRFEECFEASKLLEINYLSEICYDNLEYHIDKLRKLSKLNLAKRLSHVVNEIRRVKLFNNLLQNYSNQSTNNNCLSNDNINTDDDTNLCKKLGGLMIESHNSSKILFENSTEELDFIVSLLTSNSKVFGCRLTGGGFGGAVLAFTSKNFRMEDENLIKNEYNKKFSSELFVVKTKIGEKLSFKIIS